MQRGREGGASARLCVQFFGMGQGCRELRPRGLGLLLARRWPLPPGYPQAEWGTQLPAPTMHLRGNKGGACILPVGLGASGKNPVAPSSWRAGTGWGAGGGSLTAFFRPPATFLTSFQKAVQTGYVEKG